MGLLLAHPQSLLSAVSLLRFVQPKLLCRKMRLTNTLGVCNVLHISDFDQFLQLLYQIHLRPVLHVLR